MLIEEFGYKRWSDLRTLNAIGLIDKPQHIKSSVFALQQINHMVIVEELFRARLSDEIIPHENTNSAEVPEFDELKKRLEDSFNWYLNFASTLDEKSKHKTIWFIFADGKHGSMTVMEILFHIINHSSYHRGTIAHALDLAEVPHPIDGYAIYIHEKEPSRRDQTI